MRDEVPAQAPAGSGCDGTSADGGVFWPYAHAALDELKGLTLLSHDPVRRRVEYELSITGASEPRLHARLWSDHFGGAHVYLKLEDLNHTARTR